MRDGGMTRRFAESVGIITGLCLVLFGLRALMTGTIRYWFIPENLLLAWGGLLFAWLLTRRLGAGRWLSWQNITLSLAWIFFLPNTWYVLTDFIHVYETGEISELYDIALISSLVFCGFMLGLASLFLVHKQLLKRLSELKSYLFIEAAILLSSFAIYLGRDLRWNTWDVVTNPGGLVLNITDRILDPLGHLRALNITALFFVFLSVVYLAFYHAAKAVPPSKTGRQPL